MTIGTSIVLIAIGAILKWAVTANVHGFNIQTAGTVLLVVGIIGLILSVLYTFWWSRARTHEVRTYDNRYQREPR
jgi:Zn-dependent protease with chaperone function